MKKTIHIHVITWQVSLLVRQDSEMEIGIVNSSPNLTNIDHTKYICWRSLHTVL